MYREDKKLAKGNRMRLLWASALLLGTIWQGGCGTSKQTVAITISPTAATVKLGQTQQFTATVTGNSNKNVTWTVNGVNWGNTSVGNMLKPRLNTAPGQATNPTTPS